jgi:hypothetical protein
MHYNGLPPNNGNISKIFIEKQRISVHYFALFEENELQRMK